MEGLLGSIKRTGRGLLDALNAFGSTTFTPGAASAQLEQEIDPEVRDALREQYDAMYRAARQQAIRGGANLANMDGAARLLAEPAYAGGVMDAVKAAREIRASRESERRRESLAEMIAKLQGVNDDQRAYLSAASPESQEELLGKHLFSSQGSVPVGSGFQRVVGDDGRVYAMYADPGSPNGVRVVDTGVRENTLTPEQRNVLALQDPRYAELLRQRQFESSFGREGGQVQMQALQTAQETISSSGRAAEGLRELRKQLATLDTGLSGPALAKVNADFQRAMANINQQALESIGRLKAMGVNLAPVSNEELDLLRSTSPQLTYQRDANLKIIDDRLRVLDSIIRGSLERYRWMQAGNPIYAYPADRLGGGAGAAPMAPQNTYTPRGALDTLPPAPAGDDIPTL